MRVNTQSNAGSYYETADFALDNNDKRLVKRGRSLHQFLQWNIFLLTHIHTIMICFNDKNTICTTDWNVIDSMIGTLENSVTHLPKSRLTNTIICEWLRCRVQLWFQFIFVRCYKWHENLKVRTDFTRASILLYIV